MKYKIGIEVTRDDGQFDSSEHWEVGDRYAYELIRNLLREMLGRGTIVPS